MAEAQQVFHVVWMLLPYTCNIVLANLGRCDSHLGDRRECRAKHSHRMYNYYIYYNLWESPVPSMMLLIMRGGKDEWV